MFPITDYRTTGLDNAVFIEVAMESRKRKSRIAQDTTQTDKIIMEKYIIRNPNGGRIIKKGGEDDYYAMQLARIK